MLLLVFSNCKYLDFLVLLNNIAGNRDGHDRGGVKGVESLGFRTKIYNEDFRR